MSTDGAQDRVLVELHEAGNLETDLFFIRKLTRFFYPSPIARAVRQPGQ